MTVQSRGARSRRGGRGPGWPLLTGLLILAIAASSTLVFTDRVELLRLAVILSLWAAVVAAFVTVVYRRQSELDQARARDMKFVYDLQLDREISARREYELSVEAQLRRQLSRELRTQAAEEMSALRSELASLRSHLEIMLGADLSGQPVLGSDRGAVAMSAAPGRVESSRISVVADEVAAIGVGPEAVTESPIIDVPEEPLTAGEPPAPRPPTGFPGIPRDQRGNHRRRGEEPAVAQTAPLKPVVVPPGPSLSGPPPSGPPWRPPEVRRGRHSTGDGGWRGAGAQPPEPPESPTARETGETAVPPDVLRGRHSVGSAEQRSSAGRHRDPEPRDYEPQDPRPRDPGPHGATEEPSEVRPRGQHTGGQSVADLMSRLQVNDAAGGGGRRRRGD